MCMGSWDCVALLRGRPVPGPDISDGLGRGEAFSTRCNEMGGFAPTRRKVLPMHGALGGLLPTAHWGACCRRRIGGLAAGGWH